MHKMQALIFGRMRGRQWRKFGAKMDRIWRTAIDRLCLT
jgi:hypothetical protein